MPKSGLLSMLAANAASITNRFHTFTGQVWAVKKGVPRFVLKLMDRVLVLSSSCVLADSESQRRFLIDHGVVKESSIYVLGDGSIAGVDLARFSFSADVRSSVRKQLLISADAVVFLFVGRLTRDKGLLELVSAFANVAAENENVHLIIVGPDEDDISTDMQDMACGFSQRMHSIGFTDRPEDYMNASDVFCLPSYREGFGSVIIEAAAIGLPAIASNIYGVTDAIEDAKTGVLCEAGSVEELKSAMSKIVADDDFRLTMGAAAKLRAQEKFSERRVTNALLDFYEARLNTTVTLKESVDL